MAHLLPILLSLSLHVGTAHAQFAVQDLPEGPLSPADLARTLKAFQSDLGAPVLVAAAGPEAYRAVETALRTLSGVPLEPAQVPYRGDLEAEMSRALERAAIGCGLRVSAHSPGLWEIQAFGQCDPPEEERLEEEEILETEARLDEVAITDATFASPLDRYRTDRLVRVHVSPTRSNYGVRWTLQDGQGHLVSTAAFARMSGDVVTHTRLLREDAASERRAWIQAGLGGALILGAGYTAFQSWNLLPQWRDFKPGSAYTYPSDEEWQQATEQARYDYEEAREAVPYTDRVRAEDGFYTSIFLGGAGLSLLVTVPLVRRGVQDRQEVPALYYSPARAQALIDAYNAELRRELGLDAPAGQAP